MPKMQAIETKVPISAISPITIAINWFHISLFSQSRPNEPASPIPFRRVKLAFSYDEESEEEVSNSVEGLTRILEKQNRKSRRW
jgi:hypothetical protein